MIDGSFGSSEVIRFDLIKTLLECYWTPALLEKPTLTWYKNRAYMEFAVKFYRNRGGTSKRVYQYANAKRVKDFQSYGNWWCKESDFFYCVEWVVKFFPIYNEELKLQLSLTQLEEVILATTCAKYFYKVFEEQS